MQVAAHLVEELAPEVGVVFEEAAPERRHGRGVLFDAPSATRIADAVTDIGRQRWDRSRIKGHAGGFSEDRFAKRLREIVTEERAAIR